MIKSVDSGLVIKFKVLPNSSKNDVLIEDELIKVKLTAQPIENKANKALVEFLSKLLKVPKSEIKIIKGETSKEKTILFSNLTEDKKNFIISQLTK